MLIEVDGRRPTLHPDARIAPSAILRGDVQVGAGSVVLDHAVLTAESGPVRIGQECVVMEQAVLRGVVGNPCLLGDGILVGPHAHLTGCRIEDDVFVATGASVFNGAVLRRGCEVRIRGVVHVNSHLEADTTVPIGWIAVGRPARLFPPEAHDELWPIQQAMRFDDTVWGASQASTPRSPIRRYAAHLRRRLAASTPGDAASGPDGPRRR